MESPAPTLMGFHTLVHMTRAVSKSLGAHRVPSPVLGASNTAED